MRATVTPSGQVLIPIAIRRRLGLGPASAVEWVLEGGTARVIPIPSARVEPKSGGPAPSPGMRPGAAAAVDRRR